MDELICVSDFEREAERKLDPGVAGYFFGGACDEVTLGESCAAWRRWRPRPRVLAGLGEWDTRVEVLGAEARMPVLVAPVAYQRLVDPEGEIAMARAAAAAGTAMCLSTLATTRPSELAAAVPEARRWFQLYCFRDGAVTRALMDEAVDSGFEAIVVTVDAPRGGRRERDLRTGFKIPEGLGVPSVQAALGSDRAVTIEETFALMDPALDWTDLEALASASSVPVLLKGVLTAEDAARRAAVLVDGGVRRGTDVAVALALGADAVLVGRPALWGLAVGSSDGAARVLELLRAELELALALCGCASPAALGAEHVRKAPPAAVYSA